MTSDGPDSKGQGESGVEKEGFEHITEGYVRFTDVAFHWCKAINPWQANAVKALIHNNALVHPDHPLHIPGEEGIRLYMGTDRMGKQRLLFSLHQLEYLQYYIHEMRLTDPQRIIALVSQSQGASEGEEYIPPAESEDIPEWVPLPSIVIKRDHFQRLEPIFLTTAAAIKQMVKQLHKHNRDAEKEVLRNNPTPSMINRQTAKIENAISGPGMRKGPFRERTRSSPPQRRKKGQDGKGDGEEDGEGEQGEQTGWGGFPLKRAEPGPDEVAATTARISEEGEGGTQIQDTESTEVAVKEPSSASNTVPKHPEVADLPDVSADIPTSSTPEVCTAHTTSNGNTMSNATLTSLGPPVENFTNDYYYHAEQAYIVAKVGGLYGALGAGNSEAGPPPEIGRSLFLALDITTWEADADIVLEVGWAAMWYQAKLEPAEEEDSGFEEMRDAGHYILQDYLLTKNNGHWRPNNRDHYRFGDTLPIAGKNVSSHAKRLITDLSRKAGGGPIYVLIHSPDMSHGDLGKKLGLESKTWERRLKPSGWEFASYACLDGIGKTFVLDTAILFAAIEHDPKQIPAPMYTKKTLEEVAWIMFGREKDRAPVFAGNAGNDALYNLEVFLAMVASDIPLAELRKDYQQSQQAVRNEVNEVNELQAADSELEERDTTKVVQTIPLTPIGDDRDEAEVQPSIRNNEDNDEGYDSEEDVIKGVFYNDEQGNLVRIQ